MLYLKCYNVTNIDVVCRSTYLNYKQGRYNRAEYQKWGTASIAEIFEYGHNFPTNVCPTNINNTCYHHAITSKPQIYLWEF